MRRNAFVFNWAMAEQVRRYRAMLDADAEDAIT
jgi:hypothetical protein